MTLLPVFVFFYWFSAAINSVPGDYDYDNKLPINYDSMFSLDQIIGYPQISTNQQLDGSFSGEQTEKIFSHKSHNEKVDDADYRNPCANDLLRVAHSLREKWAISMIDADSKLPAGVLSGNRVWVGAHRKCLDIQAPSDYTYNQTGFGGRYCTLSWIVSALKAPVISSLCVPDTCQETDLRNLTILKLVRKSREILPQFNNQGKSLWKYMSLTSIACQEKVRDFDAGAIVVLGILFMLLTLVIAGTSLTVKEFLFPSPSYTSLEELEYGLKRSPAYKNGPSVFVRIGDFLKCFCVIKNGKKILGTSNKEENQISSLHGIRFLSMAWIIVGHTYILSATTQVLGNFFDTLKILDVMVFQMVTQGAYSVDSFFVMSGFLLSHLFLREMNTRDGKISWVTFYLHRYWRLTPVYAMVMAFDMTVSWHLMSGPFLPQDYRSECKKTWWWNLLYINNFTSESDLCLRWTWYLANDMQFYVISPLFLYALWKWPKIGLGIITSLFCGSCISNFAISYHYDLPAAYTTPLDPAKIAIYVHRLRLYFEKLYTKPYTRIGPYLIGVLLGYVFHKLNGRKNFLSKRVQVIGWMASTALGIYTIFGMFHITPSRLKNAFHNAFDRYCFSASVAWVIFACITGHGGDAVPWFPIGILWHCLRH